MTASCALVAMATLFAKALGRGIDGGAPMHAFQIVFARFFFACVVLTTLAAIRRMPLGGAPLALYAGRSFFGWAGVASLFAAAAAIPLADATAISFLNPIFAMMLAIPILRERVAAGRWIAAGIALFGAALLIRPGAGGVEPGALIALGGAVMMAFEVIFAKLLARTENLLRLLCFTNLLGLGFATISSAFVWRAPTAEEWAAMAAVGALMLAGQALFMVTLKLVDASLATPFFYGTLVFAAIYDAIWFGAIPAPLSLLGAALILAGAVLLILSGARAAPPRAKPPHTG